MRAGYLPHRRQLVRASSLPISIVLCVTVIGVAACSPAPSSSQGGVPARSGAGGMWSASAFPPGKQSLDGVSCATSNACEAVGGPSASGVGEEVHTLDGGAKWSSGALTANELYGVSCPTASNCVAVGLYNASGIDLSDGNGKSPIVYTSDGGATWLPASLPAPNASSLFGVNAVSCRSSQYCVAVGNGLGDTAFIYETSDGGADWTGGEIPQVKVQQMSGVSCPSVNECVVVGSAPDGTTTFLRSLDGGTSWTASNLSQAVVYAVSCPSVEICVAVGEGMALTSTNGGASWAMDNYVTVGDIDAVSCPSTDECIAVGNTDTLGNVEYSTNRGKSWASGKIPRWFGADDGTVAVSCPTVRECVAVSGRAMIASSNGGRTWE